MSTSNQKPSVSPSMTPYEAVRYHVDKKPRPNNPTYNSVFMNSSLNNFVASPYSKSLMKDTQYKKNFDKLDGSMASYQSMLKSMGRTKENIFQASNRGMNFSTNSSHLSGYPTNTLNQSHREQSMHM